MQCGHGGLYGKECDYPEYIWDPKNRSRGRGEYNEYIDVPKLINKYRNDVNQNVMVYLIQTAGYHDILVPECFNKTFIGKTCKYNINNCFISMVKVHLSKYNKSKYS